VDINNIPGNVKNNLEAIRVGLGVPFFADSTMVSCVVGGINGLNFCNAMTERALIASQLWGGGISAEVSERANERKNGYNHPHINTKLNHPIRFARRSTFQIAWFWEGVC